MTLFILESVIFFSILCDYINCECDICNHPVTGVTIMCDVTSYSLHKSKIMKSKMKSKNKIKEKENK